MNKYQEVLDALDKLEECAYGMEDLPQSNWIDLAENQAELDLKIMDWVETIKFELFKGKQALLELKAIKDANPSEALECLMYLKAEFRNYPSAYEAIKQALIKSQEQEKKLKALEIIKKKNVDVEGFKEALKSAIFLQLETYNNWVRYDKERMLVEEEFDLLKGILNDEQ